MSLLKKIRLLIVFFIIALILSGVTAFPVETELYWLLDHPSMVPAFAKEWLQNVYAGLVETNNKYPMLAYGFDWLAFAHIVIAMTFIGPLKEPVKNKWVIDWALLACVAVIPLALQFWSDWFDTIVYLQKLDLAIGRSDFCKVACHFSLVLQCNSFSLICKVFFFTGINNGTTGIYKQPTILSKTVFTYIFQAAALETNTWHQ